MKTVLAVVGGGASDAAVFEAAFDAGQRLGAHIKCLHIRIDSGEAATYTPHVCYAMGAGLREALARLKAESATRSATAFQHFREACTRRSIPVVDRPGTTGGTSAAWREENGDALARIVAHARFQDLVVAARPSGPNGMRRDFLEELLVACGRPVLIPAPVTRPAFDTVMVCWKDAPEAARALGAATAFLHRAKRVVAVGVVEGERPVEPSLDMLRASLAWHGVAAETRALPASDSSVSDTIDRAARDCDADLIVMGAYGHSRARELVLGGCTQHFIAHSARPVLLMH